MLNKRVFGDEDMRLLRNKKGLSVVVTTLIILVVSVLLATVVTFYAINVTTTRVQEEYLQITELHVWCTNDGNASAAFMVTNTGGRDVVIDKITVRGRTAESQNIYYWKLSDNDTLPTELEWVESSAALGGHYTQLGSNSLILPSGNRMVVYIFELNHISTSDIGVTVGVIIFTANAQYHKEANVEAA